MRGTISGGQLVPSTYASHIVTDEKVDEVRMVISSGNVRELVADPPSIPSPIAFRSPKSIAAAWPTR